MFWKILILFASILTGSIAKINVQHWNSRDTTVHCKDDGISSYCENCAAIQFCNDDGSDGSKTSCESGYSCLGNGDFSACVATSSVPGCACPATGITTIPDPYNNQNFILCDNGVGIVELCPNGGYFNPETKRCQEDAITTTTLTPPIEPCNGEFDIVQVSCTTYRVCHSDGTTGAVYECEPGSYFDAATKECVQYLPFSCPYTETAQYFTDNHNCSQFHLCIEGTVIGQPNTCSGGQVFEEEDQMCKEETETNCNSVEDCGICPDDQTRFPIDCNRYYQCTAEDGSQPYTPVETYCNPGFYFDPVYLECRASVDGCPAFT